MKKHQNNPQVKKMDVKLFILISSINISNKKGSDQRGKKTGIIINEKRP